MVKMKIKCSVYFVLQYARGQRSSLTLSLSLCLFLFFMHIYYLKDISA